MLSPEPLMCRAVRPSHLTMPAWRLRFFSLQTSTTYVTIHLQATQVQKELPIGSARSALRASLGAGDQANQSWSIASAFYDSYQARAYTQAQDGLGSTPTDERRLWQRRKKLQSPTQPGLSLPPPRPPRCCRRNAIFRSRRFSISDARRPHLKGRQTCTQESSEPGA